MSVKSKTKYQLLKIITSTFFIRIFIIGIDTMERLKIDIIEAALDEFNEKER